VFITIGISLSENNFQILKKQLPVLTDFLSRKLEDRQELVLLLVQAVNYDFCNIQVLLCY
jgi:hypothetical protein